MKNCYNPVQVENRIEKGVTANGRYFVSGNGSRCMEARNVLTVEHYELMRREVEINAKAACMPRLCQIAIRRPYKPLYAVKWFRLCHPFGWLAGL